MSINSKNEVNEKGGGVKEKVTDETLLALHSMFGSPLEKALELLETNCVVYLRSPQGRYVIQVTSSSGIPYTLFPGVNYCSCPAYHYQVIGTQTFLTCKHVLAARLAEIMHKGRDLSVSSDELTRVLCAAANLDGDAADSNSFVT
ncbi:zinc finger SWIM domain-containing protein 7-like isoform X2 [Periplaneta americana]|uniref:zinc finger SWIM domain-containing protein 7-like isoform X2 n=1 Tax=Periplaneta americana TaxID=6978 RepID=UPI0037E6F978